MNIFTCCFPRTNRHSHRSSPNRLAPAILTDGSLAEHRTKFYAGSSRIENNSQQEVTNSYSSSRNSLTSVGSSSISESINSSPPPYGQARFMPTTPESGYFSTNKKKSYLSTSTISSGRSSSPTIDYYSSTPTIDYSSTSTVNSTNARGYKPYIGVRKVIARAKNIEYPRHNITTRL